MNQSKLAVMQNMGKSVRTSLIDSAFTSDKMKTWYAVFKQMRKHTNAKSITFSYLSSENCSMLLLPHGDYGRTSQGTSASFC